MYKFLKDIVTDITGNDFDVAKVLWIAGMVSYVVYAGVHMYFNKIFDPLQYGTGLGVALGGGGFAVQQRNKEQRPVDLIVTKVEEHKEC